MDETKSTRAVTYTRVNHAARGSSGMAESAVDRQLAACHAAAEARGLTIIAEYSDTTGALHIEQRPVLQRLFDELAARQVGYVIVSDLARVSRNVRDLTAFEDRLMWAGAELLVFGEGQEQVKARRRMTSILAGFGPELAPGISAVRDGAHKNGGRA